MPKQKQIIIRFAVGILIAAIGAAGFFFTKRYFVTVPNAYALWNTANLVIAHMDKHDGAWPHNWEELQATGENYTHEDFRRSDGTLIIDSLPSPAMIADLQRRVQIDWSADPAKLAQSTPKSGRPPFQVILLRNSHSTHYAGRSPMK